MITAELLTAALLGGVIALDKSSLQMVFSEPLLLCAAAGAYLGDISTGIMMGMLWQIIWVGELPVGAAKIPDGSTGSLISTILLIQLRGEFPGFAKLLFAVSLLTGIAAAYLTGQYISDKRKFHARYIDFIDSFAERGRLLGIDFTVAAGLVEQFGSGALHTALVYFIFYNVLVFSLGRIPLFWDGLFQHITVAAWGIAAALIIHFFWNRKSFAAVILGIIAGWLIF